MRSFLLFVVALCACQTASVGRPVNPEVARIDRLVRATVLVDVECGPGGGGGGGSGSIISTSISGRTLILTAGHIIKDESCSVSITNSEGRKFAASIVSLDKEVDLMLLLVSDHVSTYYFPVATEVSEGADIVCVGYPREWMDGIRHLSVTKGTINSKVNNMYRISAGYLPGASGGSCFDTNNEVIGNISRLIWINAGTTQWPVHDQYYIVSLPVIKSFIERATK